ncbi:MAG: hypothetical protein A3E01_14545 [Gammaproteobacteria bacterium RIFCSPHIGHO2_12_FULL_63_22]|nr:MAG: hypothetical protein A3E01_14545 [Gammaproteobacteria bacterium RIFCSPHIGHO2_12_FULL_63_22]
MKGHQFNHRAKGFSLIEVLIAVVILSLGLLALASLQSSLIRAAADAKAQSLAMAVAKQKIEQLAAVQALGGADNGCVSPSAWVTGQVSCYRAITDEPATAVDGDPIATGVQAMGGIAFTVATTVTRYVYNISTLAYAVANDTALDAALVTSSPETLLPGKEFKRIVVAVAWTDASGSARSVQVEDALNGIVPRDSMALLMNRRGATARKAESIIVNPGSVAGVIPIAVGNGSNTAASNPTPELLGSNSSTYVAETRFNVYTYIPLTETTALAQSRVESSVVGCRCDTATKSTSEASLRPTYWNGLRYAIPTEATYAPIAGPKAVSGSELDQSDQCRVCCRDHHDPSGNDVNGDVKSAIAKFSPYRVTHDHNLVDSTTGAQTSVDLTVGGVYSEVCRMIRVDGIFRVAADLNNDYFAYLQARNTGISPFVPSDTVADDYGDMVKRYLKARFTDNTDSTTYNSPTSPNPYSNTYAQGTRTLSDGVTTRTYDLNEPAVEYLDLTQDARWQHARGLYIDFLGTEAIARITLAKATCTATDPNECVLPYLPFTSINLSELAEWKDVAITPDPASVGQVISVMNNGFKTSVGDVSFAYTDGSGSAGGIQIDFANAISSDVTEGMTVSGANIAPNARVVSIAGSRRRVDVDIPHTAAISVGTTITFEGSPVRGRVTPGSAPNVAGTDASFTLATASSKNAAIALQFPMNSDEVAVTDEQRYEVTSGGSPPDPTAGTFTVTGFSGYTVDATHPGVYWGDNTGTPSLSDSCNLVSAALPFTCPVTAGLGGGMRVLLGGYNVAATKSVTFTSTVGAASAQPCYYKSGSSTLIVPVVVTGTVIQNYCKNYEVTSAVAADAAATYSVAADTPYGVTNNTLATETTELHFSALQKNDIVTVGISLESNVDAPFVSCLAKKTGSTYSVQTVTYGTACE